MKRRMPEGLRYTGNGYVTQAGEKVDLETTLGWSDYTAEDEPDANGNPAGTEYDANGNPLIQQK